MPDTGAPWNIPYVASTDLVSDWPADSLALANAIDAGLDAAGGLVAVKTVVKTDTFSVSVAAGANAAVTGLSITHTVADAANRVLLFASIGAGARTDNPPPSFSFAVDGTLTNIGDAAGSRTRVGSGVAGQIWTNSGQAGFPMALHTSLIPGAGAKTYAVYLSNLSGSTSTHYVNRSDTDTDFDYRQRAASHFMLMEVKP